MSEAAVRNFGLAQANSRAQHTEHNAARMFEAQIQAIIDNPVSQKAMAFWSKTTRETKEILKARAEDFRFAAKMVMAARPKNGALASHKTLEA